MQYFFILGTNPALSTAEICALFPDSDISLIGKEAIILETDQQLNPEQLINHMGGTIKIGEILFTEKSHVKNSAGETQIAEDERIENRTMQKPGKTAPETSVWSCFDFHVFSAGFLLLLFSLSHLIFR